MKFKYNINSNVIRLHFMHPLCMQPELGNNRLFESAAFTAAFVQSNKRQ